MHRSKFLLTKFILTLVAALVTLTFVRGNDWTWVVMIAFVVTFVNYVLGDVFILPSFGNGVAAVADGLTAMLIAHIFGVMVLGFRTGVLALLMFGALITIVEYFLHPYLMRRYHRT